MEPISMPEVPRANKELSFSTCFIPTAAIIFCLLTILVPSMRANNVNYMPY